MPDIVDQASDQYQVILDSEIAEARRHLEVPINNTGKCWCCQEPVPDFRRWCDAECRDLYLTEL
jgi:hypothetical protein